MSSNNQYPSLCIPRVFLNIDEKRIRRIFDELDLGEIQRIDIVSKRALLKMLKSRVYQSFGDNPNSESEKVLMLCSPNLQSAGRKDVAPICARIKNYILWAPSSIYDRHPYKNRLAVPLNLMEYVLAHVHHLQW